MSTCSPPSIDLSLSRSAAGECSRGSSGWSVQPSAAATGLGRKLEPPHAPIVEERFGPREHRANRGTTQHLLGGPQHGARIVRLHEQHALEREAMLRERGRVGQAGRRDPREVTSGAAQPRERRHQQREFADALRFGHQLGDRPHRPPASRQRSIEFRETRRHRRRPRRVVGVRAPIHVFQARTQFIT
jgi:hypothetical protein